MVRHVICMTNDGGKAHPFTGKTVVFYNTETENPVAAHPEWATKFKTAAAARAVIRTLPARDGGYSVTRVALR